MAGNHVLADGALRMRQPEKPDAEVTWTRRLAAGDRPRSPVCATAMRRGRVASRGADSGHGGHRAGRRPVDRDRARNPALTRNSASTETVGRRIVIRHGP